MKKTSSRGFIYEEPAPEDWLLGSGKASARFGAEEIKPDGNWEEPRIQDEKQSRFGFETSNCTNFATVRALQVLALHHGFEDFPLLVSKRYTGVMTETHEDGNTPNNVIEIIRNVCGLINEAILPWTDDINKWDEYYSPKPMDEAIVRIGQRLLAKYTIGHEWVFNTRRMSVKEKHERLRQALRRGPVCVSVHAWEKKDGIYVKKKGEFDNHWTMLESFDGKYPMIRDSYSPFLKRLSPDYDFVCAKVYFMKHNEAGLTPQELTYFERVLRDIAKWLSEFAKKQGLWK